MCGVWRAAEMKGPLSLPVSDGEGEQISLRSIDKGGRLSDVVMSAPDRAKRVRHVEHIPSRAARLASWPKWLDTGVRAALERAGIATPWSHQVKAADLAWSGESVVVATGTASGKSLAYLMPALTAARRGRGRASANSGSTLYVSPTKALAADQVRALDELAVPGVVSAPYDGDTPIELRDVARAHASYLLTNPDMLHRSILPAHHRWAGFLRSLRFVILDECHEYRGVFGSHVAHVIRRLRRMCSAYGADPVFILASATSAEPSVSAERLIGRPVTAVTDDGSPRGNKAFMLWEPPSEGKTRRSVLSETSSLLADLVVSDARSVAFVRSRRAAETVAERTRAALNEIDGELTGKVAAYRAGFLAHERRQLEADLNTGRLRGVAATTALELGVDITGLDAVLIAGWPGTRASLWQQAGRAGRGGDESLAVLLARDDPLDSYIVAHPEVVFGQPVEATVLDPGNPYVMAPHICAAAAERPIDAADLDLFGPGAEDVVTSLERQRQLRRRGTDSPTWHWTKRDRAADLADLRGSGEPLVTLVEGSTGRVLGTVDGGRAHSTAHTGAVYVHQGEAFVVETLDLDESVAIVRRESPGYHTTARDVTSMRVLKTLESGPVSPSTQSHLPGARLAFGDVEVTSQVVAFTKRDSATGESLGETPLDLPERTLRTRAVWWTLPDDAITGAGVSSGDAAGSAHAAEHASIGLLPLVANCDRWDVGGLSTVRHPDTGELTVFVHDGHPGGAGFAERGFRAASSWLTATRDAVAACPCADGCPACVQSPKCGNGNNPLNKRGAVLLLNAILGA